MGPRITYSTGNHPSSPSSSLLQECNTELPDNSIAVLDSNTHHTVSGGDTQNVVTSDSLLVIAISWIQ